MVNFKEEKLQILKMIEEGKITSEEGIELLEAINETKANYIESQQSKWIKIRVFEPNNNTKVNVTIPVALLDAGIKLAGKVAPNFVPELKESGFNEKDLKELFETIKNGASGKLVDIETENGEKVEIVVE
ncbi:SHOCT-like domain-containing protein [Tepidimicrobium xylanilyticum]|uniref:Intein N-terminal splicing region n=1 Tax=Tepidimicrobium xylanilyticum TaxID=1123352 RepID=A0A1H3CHU7_9FIRM|nr:hypothetical protein [Tepidimicrobium xylanilyticum]SDX53059.1 intein N-terminal splicing region [Tepidimicrobium xylanilyticum]